MPRADAERDRTGVRERATREPRCILTGHVIGSGMVFVRTIGTCFLTFHSQNLFRCRHHNGRNGSSYDSGGGGDGET